MSLSELRHVFGDQLQHDEPLARFTSSRIGGPADFLLTAESADDLAEFVSRLWTMDVPFQMLGGGSNVLISDAGIRGVIVLNKARNVEFDPDSSPPTVWAESGSNFGALARQAAQKGMSGLEWAAGIPGTIGGAIFGNAGAHGGDITSNLMLAEILHRNQGRQKWTLDQFEYSYRSSVLKRHMGQAVILSATLRLEKGDPIAIEKTLDENVDFRRKTQPPGASMGSMFKNPPDDFAGRLIEEAGLKGTRVGEAEISSLHGNFFVNHGGATAQDVYTLIRQAAQRVKEKFGIELELEIQLMGDWVEEKVK